MKIRADLRLPAIVRSNELPWFPSPMPGVDRRMLERAGEEVARATSIVRYAPRSRFSEHTHGGGEELLVLEGAFSDQHGEFSAGTYLRNPVGSSHAPRSDDGCVLFVKLHWMHAADQERVRARLDTAVRADEWEPLPDADAHGVTLRRLHAFAGEDTSVCRIAKGAEVERWPCPGGLELLVVAGSCTVERQKLGRNGWARLPSGCDVHVASTEGCVLLLKRGHLLAPPPLPS